MWHHARLVTPRHGGGAQPPHQASPLAACSSVATQNPPQAPTAPLSTSQIPQIPRRPSCAKASPQDNATGRATRGRQTCTPTEHDLIWEIRLQRIGSACCCHSFEAKPLFYRHPLQETLTRHRAGSPASPPASPAGAGALQPELPPRVAFPKALPGASPGPAATLKHRDPARPSRPFPFPFPFPSPRGSRARRGPTPAARAAPRPRRGCGEGRRGGEGKGSGAPMAAEPSPG